MKKKRVPNRARLLRLAKHLDAVPDEEFDYGSWGHCTSKGTLKCGTTACAMGHATQVPEFKKLGLRWLVSPCGFSCIVIRGVDDNTFDYAENNLDTGAVFFGLTKAQANFLFVPDATYLGRHSPKWNATPKEVAQHIRKFVKSLQKPRW